LIRLVEEELGRKPEPFPSLSESLPCGHGSAAKSARAEGVDGTVSQHGAWFRLRNAWQVGRPLCACRRAFVAPQKATNAVPAIKAERHQRLVSGAVRSDAESGAARTGTGKPEPEQPRSRLVRHRRHWFSRQRERPCGVVLVDIIGSRLRDSEAKDSASRTKA
jgi:hypothetical protein